MESVNKMPDVGDEFCVSPALSLGAGKNPVVNFEITAYDVARDQWHCMSDVGEAFVYSGTLLNQHISSGRAIPMAAPVTSTIAYPTNPPAPDPDPPDRGFPLVDTLSVPTTKDPDDPHIGQTWNPYTESWSYI